MSLENKNTFPLRNNEENASIKQMNGDRKHELEGEHRKKTIFHVSKR